MSVDWFKEFEKKGHLEQGETPPTRASFKLFVQNHPLWMIFGSTIGVLVLWIFYGGGLTEKAVKWLMG